MIDIFLKGADNTQLSSDGKTTITNYNYVVPGQATISIMLVLVSFICVPIMLAIKPMVLKKRIEAEHHAHAHAEIKSVKSDFGAGNNGDTYEVIKDILKKEGSDGGSHSIGDIFIH